MVVASTPPATAPENSETAAEGVCFARKFFGEGAGWGLAVLGSR